MNKKTIEEFKVLLAQEREKLAGELVGVTGKAVASTDIDASFPEYGSKEDENAAEVASYSDNLSLEGKIEDALRDVEKALVSIEAGTYGVCKYCKQDIDDKRLRARPASSSCIACKEAIKSSV